MKIFLKNIGKIDEAAVEIHGITVIAGENDTGKSTVGRALFAVFNSFSNIQEQIKLERVMSIANQIDRMGLNSISSRLISRFKTEETAESIVSRLGLNECRDKRDIIHQEILTLLPQDEGKKQYLDETAINVTVSRINEIVNIPDKELLKAVLNKKLDSEFNGQVCNIFSEEPGEIDLEIGKQKISVIVDNDGVSKIDDADNLSLHTEAIYMDDPFVLDEMQYRYRYMQMGYSEHRRHLCNKLFSPKSEGTLADEIIAKDKLESIYDKIYSACSGEVVSDKRSGLGYKGQNSERILSVRNLSTGLKTFAVLKMLLMNGAIESNGTIILDEPEIHLHPEWQLLFAEIIVLIQKNFGVHILLNTHSPYFLRAIQVYSAKYETADICRYYLSEIRGGMAVISDVTDCPEKIYAKLSRPLQKLEDERWMDEGTE